MNNKYEKLLKDITDKAVQETFAQGRPITIVEDDWIVKKYSNGSTIRIKPCKHSVHVTKTVYKL